VVEHFAPIDNRGLDPRPQLLDDPWGESEKGVSIPFFNTSINHLSLFPDDHIRQDHKGLLFIFFVLLDTLSATSLFI